MELRQAVDAVEKSSCFGSWKKKHSGFLAHAFVMLDEPNKNIWQLGYYDAASGKMSTFIVDSEKISVVPEQEVFRSNSAVEKLAVEKIVLPVAEAVGNAEKCRREHYKNELPLKTFFIVQMHNRLPVYSVTFFTQSFKAINIKISAVDGAVVEHSASELARFG